MGKTLSRFYIIGTSILFYLAIVSPAFAQIQDPATFRDLNTLFKNVLGAVITIGGFSAFVMLVFGGFRYLTAQGDPKSVSAARGTITWAIVGLAFIILSWLILKFTADFTGLPLTKFCIPGEVVNDSGHVDKCDW